MTAGNTNLSIINLNINGLNFLIERLRLINYIKKISVAFNQRKILAQDGNERNWKNYIELVNTDPKTQMPHVLS